MKRNGKGALHRGKNGKKNGKHKKVVFNDERKKNYETNRAHLRENVGSCRGGMGWACLAKQVTIKALSDGRMRCNGTPVVEAKKNGNCERNGS